MLSKLKKAKKGAVAFVLGSLLPFLLTAQAYALDVRPEQPPGTDGILKLLRYGLWIGFIVLFAYWIRGLVVAGNKRKHGETDVEAATWPLVFAIILGAAAGIWTSFTGI